MVDHGTVPPKPPEAMKSLVIQQQLQNKAVVKITKESLFQRQR